MEPIKLPAIDTDRSCSQSLPENVRDDWIRFAADLTDEQFFERCMALMETQVAKGVDDPVGLESSIRMITAALEERGVREITKISQAMLLRVSFWPEWRAAARDFLGSVPGGATALIDAYPIWAAFASQTMFLLGEVG